jgi:hypothetical protein
MYCNVAHYLKSEIFKVRELSPYHCMLYESRFKRLSYMRRLSGR